MQLFHLYFPLLGSPFHIFQNMYTSRCMRPCTNLNLQLIKLTLLISVFSFEECFCVLHFLYSANPSLLNYGEVELFALNRFFYEIMKVYPKYTIPACIPLLLRLVRSWRVPLSAETLQPMCQCDSYCAPFTNLCIDSLEVGVCAQWVPSQTH